MNRKKFIKYESDLFYRDWRNWNECISEILSFKGHKS